MMKSFLKKLMLASLAFSLYSASQPTSAASPVHQADAMSQATLQKLQAYLNGIRTMRADFVQEDPNGTLSSGKMYLKRLGKESFGKLRLEYGPPLKTEIIANGETLRHMDGATQEISEYPIDSTPASFLLRHKINFTQDLEVKEMQISKGKVFLTLQRSGDEGVSLSLIFVTSPFLRLQEWTVVDAQANKTHVTLSQVEIGIYLEDKLFAF